MALIIQRDEYQIATKVEYRFIPNSFMSLPIVHAISVIISGGCSSKLLQWHINKKGPSHLVWTYDCSVLNQKMRTSQHLRGIYQQESQVLKNATLW